MKRISKLITAMAIFSALPCLAQETTVEVGAKAPDFTATTEEEKVVDLKDYLAEKNVVLVFVRAHW